MHKPAKRCPVCDDDSLLRREFLRTGIGATAALAYATLPRMAGGEEKAKDAPETLVKRLYDSLSEKQRKEVCFAWDHFEPDLKADGKPLTEEEKKAGAKAATRGRGLLRTRVSNNWHITKPVINTDFYTDEQRQIVRSIFEGMIQPDWHARIDRQLKDDAGGFGNQQNFAIFGKPGEEKFEFVMTGRHMTIRCDGNSAEHVAFGGPIFYGHAPTNVGALTEKPGHPGNVFWHQALEANKVWEMLDGKQRMIADVTSRSEDDVAFRGKEKLDGIKIGELSSDQKEQVQKTLASLLEPYRQSDRDEVTACLKAQGGLDGCHLAFYTDSDHGGDKVWDNWRIEGPSFVWNFRGDPHVHVWVNIAADASVKTNV